MDQRVGPAMTILSGWPPKRKDVTTPKLPPPPRIAQKRSGFSVAEARTIEPSARTISASMRLSMARPKRRDRWPRPPPRVRPATPVVEMMPLGVTRPYSCATRSTSPQVAPPWTRMVWATGSMRTSRMRLRSMTRPSSHMESPAPLWPPPRMATVRSLVRAKFTAATTSSASAHRTMNRGYRSIIPL